MKCLLQIYDGRNEFYQWDYNQKLLVLDDRINQVHFEDRSFSTSVVVDVVVDEFGKRVCYIPDSLLQIPKTFSAYAYINDNKSGETLYKISFGVRPRAMPSEYVYHQDAELDKLKQRLNILEKKVDELYNQ